MSAPPNQTGQPEQQRDCKLVPVSPARTSVRRDIKSLSVTNVFNSVVVNHPHIVQGQPQEKGASPAVVRRRSLKYVNNVSCVDQLCSVKHVPNVQTVAKDLPVGARLNQFCEIWEALGARPKVLQMLKEGTLPFQSRPNLTRSPTIISWYVNSHWNLYVLEALHQLVNKNAVELVKNQESGPLQLTIFGPKTKQPVETYTRSQQSEQIYQIKKIQNGDTRNNRRPPQIARLCRAITGPPAA